MDEEICRLCLCKDNLRPIFVDMERSKRYTIVLSLTTGLKIEHNDGLPQTICTECTELVNSALNLRNQSHISEKRLLKSGYTRNVAPVDKIASKKRANRKSIIKNEDEDHKNCESTSKTDEDRFSDNEFPKLEVSVDFDRLTDVKDENAGLEFNVESANIIQPCKVKENSTSLSRKEKRELYLSLVDGELSPNGPVKCKICKKTVSKWSSFISHSKLHLGFKYVCEFCGKSFISSTQLNRHCRSKHGMQRELACSHCDYMALDNTQLVLHERRAHTGERPYTCDACGASYFSRRCLIQHIENHAIDKTIQCERCPQLFKSRRHLARHTYTAHTSKAYTYKCPVCGQHYRNFKYIRVHLRKLHGLTSRQAKIVKIKL